MKAEEPLLAGRSNSLIPHLRNYIVEKVEKEEDVTILQQIYSVISPESEETYVEKFAKAKEQTEQFCVPEIAKALEAEGFMIDKPYPFDDDHFDFDKVIEEDERDEVAPREWVEKMFPELYVRG